MQVLMSSGGGAIAGSSIGIGRTIETLARLRLLEFPMTTQGDALALTDREQQKDLLGLE